MEQVLIQLVLIIVKETSAKIQGGNNKTVVWSTKFQVMGKSTGQINNIGYKWYIGS